MTCVPRGDGVQMYLKFEDKEYTNFVWAGWERGKRATFYEHHIWEPPEVIDHFGLNAY